MTPPSRATPAGRAYNDLQRLARDTRRPVQEVLQLYVLEAFLDRLSQSPLAGQFVLKGGVLLAAFGERRPTRDIDLHAQALDNDLDEMRQRIIDIVALDVPDGVDFDARTARAEPIRDEDAYAGVRVSIRATLATARLPFHVDINVGDPVSPSPQVVELPRLLGGVLSVRGYPLEMVHAEKIVTAIARGTVNTRWRDFADVVALSRQHPVDGTTITSSIRRVAAHRGVDLVPLARVLDGFGDIGQARWTAWRRRQLLEDRTPADFAELLDVFITFADPVIAGVTEGLRWDPVVYKWE